MITPAHAQLMARYNRWQNRSVYAAAAALTDQQRRAPRGAFFGSIHATLTHLLWADQNWLGRFTGKPSPMLDYPGQPWPRSPKESVNLQIGWDDLAHHRAAFDEAIVAWAAGIDPSWLGEDLIWTNSAGRQNRQARWMLVTHFFNHQTHHRGQVHAMLTACGAKPEDTDIPWMPADQG
jgi:uncharacterized damage-inducible protein DinB